MVAHIYRHGDPDGMHIETNRVTLRDGIGLAQRALVLGTLPDITSIVFEDIDWFWIEES